MERFLGVVIEWKNVNRYAGSTLPPGRLSCASRHYTWLVREHQGEFSLHQACFVEEIDRQARCGEQHPGVGPVGLSRIGKA
jgi:hypothetical protein